MKIFKILVCAGLALVMLSGFDMARHSIPTDEILSGGPPKDGIPATDNPELATVKDAGFMKNKDRVIGITHNGISKAYAIKILNWHEIVNDKFGEKSVVVTFCPLCGTGMVFDADSAGRGLTFGVSGLLYQSDMLLYDRQTESLWSQVKSEAVTGKMMGRKLKLLPSSHTTWGAWKKKHPKTLVLTTKTGNRRDYDRDPYKGYATVKRLYFPVNRQSEAYHPKEQVIGVQVGKVFKAWPFIELSQARLPVKEKLNGVSLRVDFDKKTRTATVYDDEGKEYPSVVAFWFAWYAFHPETAVYKAKD